MAAEVALVARRCSEAQESNELDLAECKLVTLPQAVFVLTNELPLTSVDLSRNALKAINPLISQWQSMASSPDFLWPFA